MRSYITGMSQDRDEAVHTGLPGDTHWYDLPDDEAESEEEEQVAAPRRPWWRRPRLSVVRMSQGLLLTRRSHVDFGHVAGAQCR
ncbi:hypothetical protein ITP53_29650 [Nonomuraea sp. K274]|uniref:Uncharacterized protein n=1 Tax=Nonomuraea cypriaca TaxID=1187855 RepID=A0A931AGQ3_9ACTN|nr:hypothetical protein [Nonomuraea cypriaca]MBF8189820.1 hypothetical protein [Nonomuraea cypriaca]